MIHHRTLAEFYLQVHDVLTQLTKPELQLKHVKSACAGQTVQFGGFEIDKPGIDAQKHTAHVVIEWLPAENSQGVRGYLGSTSCHRMSVKHYGYNAMP